MEKVAEAKPVDDAVGKITEKTPVGTDAAPDPVPKPPEKPVEKKPDPPKPVAENKPKDEPKPIEKKPDPPKVDPIAEALKKEEVKKPAPKPEAKAAPPPPIKKREDRNTTRKPIAALVDKRDPARQAVYRRNAEFERGARHCQGHRVNAVGKLPVRAGRARLTHCWQRDGGGSTKRKSRFRSR